MMIDTPDKLDDLADHCIEAKGLIEEIGSDTMRMLIDLLLFEIGKTISNSSERLRFFHDEGRS